MQKVSPARGNKETPDGPGPADITWDFRLYQQPVHIRHREPEFWGNPAKGEFISWKIQRAPHPCPPQIDRSSANASQQWV